MDSFDGIRFKGQFRDYQQRVLDHAEEYWKDGKLHIVAAPGSGKTILGLELIRRLGAPCIVFSPTSAIRQQWGDRFRDMFLDTDEAYSSLFSTDLHDIKFLTSITYQALYTAVDKVPVEEAEEDCSDIDLLATMKSYGIKTLCLDEAHHLKNEWQKALETFIASLDKDVTVISLTATPPYDAEGSEWNRYKSICGEIDEEIFVPELVGQKNLCPHQDYIYFNYPTKAEAESFHKHREQAALAIEELRQLQIFSRLHQHLVTVREYESLFPETTGYIALSVLLSHYGFPIPKKLVRELTAKRALPPFDMPFGETALQFLLDGSLLSRPQKDEILSVLKSHSLYEKKKVTLALTEGLKRSLISSVGKLESIQTIANHELTSMGSRLRMLVLTDYIKKESLAQSTCAESFHSVNIVSIFETLRRGVPEAKLGVLSGSLIILPASIDLGDVKHTKEPIPNTDYCTVTFPGSIHRSIACVGKLFREGQIQILVGTKSLLGEGWDSPCINSLILASFVGSFVLSNQMRGRAIRIDKDDPEKAANIWHLVTLEPEHLYKEQPMEKLIARLQEDPQELRSWDYHMLKRRFDAFMGPNYSTGTIESGIERITALKPPFDKEGIRRINAEMLSLSARREDMARAWHNEVGAGKFAVCVETEVPKEARVPVFTFDNLAFFFAVLLGYYALNAVWQATASNNFPLGVGLLLLFVLSFRRIKRFLFHRNPAASIKTLGTAVYRTLCKCGLISPSAKVETQGHRDLLHISLYLRNASIHDQNVFNAAMEEMLSPIENPRYILIPKRKIGGYRYRCAFACPSVIGKKKDYAELLAKELKGTTDSFDLIYTHREDGRKLILKCRKRSYITFNEKLKGRKYRVSHLN